MKTNKVRAYCIALFSVGMLVGTCLQGVSFWYIDTSMNSYSCQGIDAYYSGKSFLVDSFNFIDRSGYVEGDPKGFSVLPPSMAGGEGWDCEDISHGINCLSSLYTITCNYYYTVDYSGIMPKGKHIGIECEVDDKMVTIY